MPRFHELLQARTFQYREVAASIQAFREKIAAGYHLPPSYTQAYYNRRIEPYLHAPTYVPGDRPDVLYRGMYVSVDELSRILEQGHDVDKVKWVAGGGGLSFSSSLEEAKTYIFHSADSRAEGIGVVFEIKKSADMKPLVDLELNPTHTIFKTAQSVPPEQTVDVLLWGEWGFERIGTILEKAKADQLVPHQTWTGAFANTGR